MKLRKEKSYLLQYYFSILGTLVALHASIYLSKDPLNVHPVQILGENQPLVNVTDVFLHDDLAVVLTASFPAIHVFRGKEFEEYLAFGKEGNGPMELQMAASVGLSGDTLLVLDSRPNICKIIRFTLNGEYISSQPIRGRGFCHRSIWIRNKGIIETSEIFGNSKEIVVLEDGEVSLITRLDKTSDMKLPIPGGPMNSYTYSNPFLAEPVWGINNSGNLVIWEGRGDALYSMSILSGEKSPYLTVSPNDIPIEEQDVYHWVERKFKTGVELFGHHDFFKNVRKEVKRKIQIPEYYPLLNRIKIDPNGGIWLQRAFSRAEGEIWSYFLDGRSESEQKMTFPPGRKIMVFGERLFAAHTKDESGAEYVELYEIEELKR